MCQGVVMSVSEFMYIIAYITKSVSGSAVNEIIISCVQLCSSVDLHVRGPRPCLVVKSLCVCCLVAKNYSVNRQN